MSSYKRDKEVVFSNQSKIKRLFRKARRKTKKTTETAKMKEIEKVLESEG